MSSKYGLPILFANLLYCRLYKMYNKFQQTLAQLKTTVHKTCTLSHRLTWQVQNYTCTHPSLNNKISIPMIPIRFSWRRSLEKLIYLCFISQIWTGAQHPVLNLVEFATSDFFVFVRRYDKFIWTSYSMLLLKQKSEEVQFVRCHKNLDVWTL